MDFKCDACSKVTSVPDEKVPVGKSFSFGCPQCGEKVVVPAEKTVPEKAPEPVKDVLAVSPDDEEVEYYTAEDKVVLICDEKNFKEFEKTFTSLGYKVSHPKGIIDALKKMKFFTYHVVILNEEFDKEPEKGYTVFDYIAPLPMATRRKMFIVQIGKDLRSEDKMRALSNSMNLVYNEGELKKFQDIFERSLTEHERFYQTYVDTLKARGQY